MSGVAIEVGPLLAVVLALLTVIASAAMWFGRLGTARTVAFAALRAVVQLAAVALLITAVLASGWWTALFVLVMFSVAAWTSAQRISGWRRAAWASAPIAVGAAPVIALLLASGTVPARPVAVVPIAGILIGGAMTATSLAGRRALDELHTRFGEYEAGLSVGLAPRDAALEISRGSAWQALIPAVDQTRTVGLVTLPGAFVGALLGGASPVQAGAVQVLILLALLAVEALAVLLTVDLVARGRIRPRPATSGA